MPDPISVDGLIQTQQNVQQAAADLYGQPMLDAMLTAVLLVEASAKQYAPVDTGDLRASISHQVVSGISGEPGVQGIVGSNKMQALWMEQGTGTFAGHAAVKMPPPSALDVWASRHGTTGRAVAWAIYKAGGLKARHFFQRAFDDNQQRIIDLLGQAVSAIVDKANGGGS